MAKIKKAQTGAGVPKGYVRGEMSEGRLYKKADQDKWEAGMADALNKQAGKGKYAPKPATKSASKKTTPKAQNGKSFGMLSVKAGIDKNPKPTQADRIAGAKGLAKKGAKVSKSSSMKKCKYGCK